MPFQLNVVVVVVNVTTAVVYNDDDNDVVKTRCCKIVMLFQLKAVDVFVFCQTEVMMV